MTMRGEPSKARKPLPVSEHHAPGDPRPLMAKHLE